MVQTGLCQSKELWKVRILVGGRILVEQGAYQGAEGFWRDSLRCRSTTIGLSFSRASRH